jgi:hypothetical protein
VFGCIKKLGCLFVIVFAALLFFTRDYWMPIYRRVTRSGTADTTAVAAGGGWQPLTPAGATRARRSVESLNGRQGPVYANVAAADLASYVFTELTHQLPAGAQDARAAVVGDRLYLKALVSPKDLGGAQALGPLGGLLPDRDTLTFGGNLEMVRPGLAQFRVRELRYGQLPIPRAMVAQLVKRSARERPAGVGDDALPLPVPPSVADIRVARGRVTLYKSTPPTGTP